MQQPKDPRKQVPGYAGYIPGIKSENVFGETYGKTSLQSGKKDIIRGIDVPAGVKFNSMATSSFINHAQNTGNIETVASLVGVERVDDMYKLVSIDSTATKEAQYENL